MNKLFYQTSFLFILFIFTLFFSFQGFGVSVSKLKQLSPVPDKVISVNSNDCSEGDGTKNSGAGEGAVGQVSVCDGEDWWLPEFVASSDNDYGYVIARDMPIDCWMNEYISMFD